MHPLPPPPQQPARPSCPDPPDHPSSPRQLVFLVGYLFSLERGAPVLRICDRARRYGCVIGWGVIAYRSFRQIVSRLLIKSIMIASLRDASGEPQGVP
jgi:hypothetical protein